MRAGMMVLMSLVALNSHALGAERMCPDPAADPHRVGELHVLEEHLTLSDYRRAVAHLRERIPNVIVNASSPEDILHDWRYYIGYFNSLLHIQGYVLKQEVLLRQVQRQAKSAGEQNRASAKYEEARSAFCKFLSTAAYHD